MDYNSTELLEMMVTEDFLLLKILTIYAIGLSNAIFQHESDYTTDDTASLNVIYNKITSILLYCPSCPHFKPRNNQ